MSVILLSDKPLTQLLDKFANAEACWFGSTRPDGRAHLAPIWHVLYNNCIYVVTPTHSVKGHNIAKNPQVALSLPDAFDVLIIEGTAQPAPALATALQPLFQAKYDWDICNDPDYTLILEISPTKLMAWGKHGEGRWRFTDGSWEAIQPNG